MKNTKNLSLQVWLIKVYTITRWYKDELLLSKRGRSVQKLMKNLKSHQNKNKAKQTKATKTNLKKYKKSLSHYGPTQFRSE